MEIIKDHLNIQYPAVSVKILVFDKQKEGSAKEYKWIRRNEDPKDEYELTITGSLPKWDVILKNTHNKHELARDLRAFWFGDNVETDDEIYNHDEADATWCWKIITHIKSDDTDVFVLLVY